MQNIWQTLKKPFLVQAPMDDVTDVVFREILAIVGKPDAFFTEFTNTDGLVSKGFDRVSRRLEFKESQRPIIAQIWGNNPESYKKSAKIIREMGFDGIDINMGCPASSVVARGSCGGMIGNFELVKSLIDATHEEAGNLPISVKTRLGRRNLQTEEWIGFLLKQNLQAIIIHGRTVSEMSKVPAHWDEIGKAVALRNKISPETIIVGNGDVISQAEADEKVKTYGVDGVMIGRGIFHNLWIFNRNVDPTTFSQKEKIEILIKHISLFDQRWKDIKDFNLMKKFYKVYISGSEEAGILRAKLMEFNNAKDTLAYLAHL